MASRDPNDLCPEMRTYYFAWKAEMEKQGRDYVLICTWRSPDEQLRDFQRGASRRRFGPHNYVDAAGRPASRAWDFAIILHGKLSWDTHMDTDHDGYPDYEDAGKIAEGMGLEWGGRWHQPVDCDHIQIKGA